VIEEVESYNNIGDLNSGVVDVVLHLDAVAEGAEHADEGVAQRRIAEVSDVGGLVGIDIGVLDDDLLAVGGGGIGVAAEEGGGVGGAVETDVDVPVAGDLEPGDAGDGADLVGELAGDFLRGLAELFGQLERDRDRELAEVALARLLDGDGNLDAVPDQDVRTECAGNLLFNGMEHGKFEYSGLERP
jgi:hypothetical protein